MKDQINTFKAKHRNFKAFYLKLAALEIRTRIFLCIWIHDEGFGADEGDGELLAEGVVEDPGAEAWVVM